MASRLALFGIVVGFALLLAGVGFAVLTLGGTLRGARSARVETRVPKDLAPPAVLPTV
jgi:hypothetical protein